MLWNFHKAFSIPRQRTSGAASLLVTAGSLWNGKRLASSSRCRTAQSRARHHDVGIVCGRVVGIDMVSLPKVLLLYQSFLGAQKAIRCCQVLGAGV